MAARFAPAENVGVHHTHDRWYTVLVLVAALDVSIWLLRQVRRQYWPVNLHTLESRKRESQSLIGPWSALPSN